LYINSGLAVGLDAVALFLYGLESDHKSTKLAESNGIESALYQSLAGILNNVGVHKILDPLNAVTVSASIADGFGVFIPTLLLVE
jgi:hypothetical protein